MYLGVYEVLSVSLGLVLIPCVNALACQCVGNVEFVGCCWRIPGTITITGTICICRRPGFFFYGNACALFVVSLVCLLVVCKVTEFINDNHLNDDHNISPNRIFDTILKTPIAQTKHPLA